MFRQQQELKPMKKVLNKTKIEERVTGVDYCLPADDLRVVEG